MTTDTLNGSTETERLSVPAPGLTLSSVVEARAQHVRRAVATLQEGIIVSEIQSQTSCLFDSRWRFDNWESKADCSAAERAAWMFVSMWLLGNSVNRGRSTLTESEEWFQGNYVQHLPRLSNCFDGASQALAFAHLSNISSEDVDELMPYLLDRHGPGSRLSVMKNPETQTARETKRQTGVFYTPPDVAEHIATQAIIAHEDNSTQLAFLDPACGTGVFLLAILRCAEQRTSTIPFDRFDFVIRSVYGVDVSPLAIDACTFVVLQKCLQDILRRKLAPWAAWHAIRLNFATGDALTIALRDCEERQPLLLAKNEIRSILLSGLPNLYPSSNSRRTSVPNGLLPDAFSTWISLGALWPEISDGFDAVIGNPPYTTLSERSDLPALTLEYRTLSGERSGNATTWLLFIEIMWRLARPGRSVGAMVVPLSIAYHRGRQYRACRMEMALNGTWFFSFFDREPHGLFGEDVKTRNAIVVRREMPSDACRGKPAMIFTGPLQKWTSRNRKALFQSISYTPLGPFTIGDGIPKLGNPEEAFAFGVLRNRTHRLSSMCQQIGSIRLANIETQITAGGNAVFVGSTAYNFLNVFRTLSIRNQTVPLSDNPVLCLEFQHENEAHLAFALLSSRLVYWLWRVLGDGFHVPQMFIESIPFQIASFAATDTERLADAGKMLWNAIQGKPLMSVNGGKSTLTYCPLGEEELRDSIDSTLIETAKLSPTFLQTLEGIVRRAVVVDENDEKRKHLNRYFSKGRSK